MFDKLSENNEERNSLQIMAKNLNTVFMISTMDNEYIIKIIQGLVSEVKIGPFVMPSYEFKLTASKDEWNKFLKAIPIPGSHDLIALLRRKALKIDGNLHPLMSHLLYFKLLLASLRPTEES